MASWLVPLDKGQGKIRPIAGGTALVKLAAAYLMENVSGRVKDLFRLSGSQYGLFMRDGATAAAHITQLNLDRNPSHIAIKIDFKCLQHHSTQTYPKTVLQQAGTHGHVLTHSLGLS